MVFVKRYASLMALYAKMDLAWLLRDTRFALLAISSDVISNIAGLSGIFLLAWRFDGIGGMDKYQVLFMLAYANILSGIVQMCGGCNALVISRIIGRGQWEHMFIIPLPFGVQLSIGIFPFTCSSVLVSGIAVMCVAAAQLGIVPTVWWVLALLGSLLVSAAIYISVSYLVGSLAFYAPVQCEEISSEVMDVMSYTGTLPLSGMPRGMQIPLISLFPAGLLAWFPTLGLLGNPPLGLPAFFPLICAVMLMFVTTYFFKRGFSFYVEKGINRYMAGGHRR